VLYLSQAREAVIGESLNKSASLVEHLGKGEWNFILNNGSTLLVSARADESWLHLDTTSGSAPLNDLWELLKLNQGLGGLSKLALLSGQATPRLRAEIPLDEEVDLPQRVREACVGLKAIAGKLHGEKVVDTLAANRPIAERPQVALAAATKESEKGNQSDLQRLCEESGWKFTERSDSKLTVDLETRSGFHQAQIEARAGGAIALTAEVTRAAPLGPNSKQATGMMLLLASARVRLGRATARETETGAITSFETLFQSRPCPAEFNHALSALAIACELSGHAVAAMSDDIVARHYLAANEREIKTS
jgi:hypothetical protein